MIIGNKEFKNDRTYIMGILNITPDSFSDGGSYTDIDTALYHTEKMITEGADMINDIWGLKYSPDMADIIKTADASVCIMHNRENAEYINLLDDVKNDLSESVAIAKKAGIADDKIILDPGIGFAKTLEDNLKITKNLDTFSGLGFPLLYGASRKSMIGLTLNLPVTERLEGTLATTAVACIKGVQFIRVHDVKENKRVIDMIEAIINA